MSDEVAEFLDACADDVSQDGHWIQGAMYGSRNGACAMGIISRNAHLFNIQSHLIMAFHAATGCDNISEWNDDPDRTQGEVADAFRTAAKFAREKAEKNV